MTAPSHLTYASTNATYRCYSSIPDNFPTYSGDKATSFQVSPALPAGLLLSATSGAISGTPSALTPQTPYTVTASNTAGSTSFTLKISVLDALPDAAIFTQSKVFYSQSGLRASVPSQSGSNIQWSIHTGTTTASIQGTTTENILSFTTAPQIGDFQLSVQVTNRSLESASATKTVHVVAHEFLPDPHSGHPRFEHTATALKNDRVLLVGGFDGTTDVSNNLNYQPRADLYDPFSDSYISVAAPKYVRALHTATLLQDGKVLITGGGPVGQEGSCEIYDPALDTWSDAAPMLNPRFGHSAVLLPNGKVLVVGVSSSGSPTPTNLSEVFDPSTNTWSATGPKRIDGVGPAVLLMNGKVLVTTPDQSHFFGDNHFTYATEIYDASSNSWSVSGDEVIPTTGATATLMHDGKVLMVGGYGTGVQIYDPSTDGWHSVASAGLARVGHSSVLLADGRVLVTGGDIGYLGELPITSKSEIYDPIGNAWTFTEMITPMTQHQSLLLKDGRVLVIGGLEAIGDPIYHALAGHELFDPVAGSWRGGGDLATGRFAHRLVTMKDGRVMVNGGVGPRDGVAQSLLATSAMFDAQKGTWSPLPNMSTPRAFHTATVLNDGRLLVTGGGDLGAINAMSSTELYDPIGNTWTPGPAMNSAREEHAATRLTNGYVLIHSGMDNVGGPDPIVSELYDPITNTFSTTGAMISALQSPASTLLPDGRVLASGSSTYNQSDWEAYDPTTGKWSVSGIMAARHNTATLLPSGSVLATGGALPELFNPVSNLWSPAASVITARYAEVDQRLSDGSVLMLGGVDFATGSLIPTAELYDPTLNTWSPAGTLNNPRVGTSTALLPDGRVMVVGGSPGYTVEFWKP